MLRCIPWSEPDSTPFLQSRYQQIFQRSETLERRMSGYTPHQELEPNGGRFWLVCLEAASIGDSLAGDGTDVARHLAGIFQIGLEKGQDCEAEGASRRTRMLTDFRLGLPSIAAAAGNSARRSGGFRSGRSTM